MGLFKVKRTNVPGRVPVGLTYGELAVNIFDKKLFVGGTSGTGPAIEIVGGGGDGTGPTWTNPAPTTASFEGIPEGTTIDLGKNPIEILELLLYPYQHVSFGAFNTGLLSTPALYELGQTAGNTNQTITWTSSQPDANWVSGSGVLEYTLDNNNATYYGLTSGFSPTADSQTVTYPAFNASNPTNNFLTIRLRAQEVGPEGAGPQTVSITKTSRWYPKLYTGRSAGTDLTGGDRTTLVDGNGSGVFDNITTYNATFANGIDGYIYFFVDDSRSITKITYNGLDVAMETVLPTPSRVSPHVNAQGLTRNYKIYRSLYRLPGAITSTLPMIVTLG
jgi:hypothetical protein